MIPHNETDAELLARLERTDPVLAELARQGFEGIGAHRESFERRDAEARAVAARKELADLTATAKSALEGTFGQEAQQLAGQTVLESDGRTITRDRYTLQKLATALRQLRVQRVPERRETRRR